MNEWVWSNGGMILTGENWSTGRKTLYSVGGWWMNEYGAMVEWYWQGKTETLEQKSVWVSLCPPQIPHWQAWDRTRLSIVTAKSTNHLIYATTLHERPNHQIVMAGPSAPCCSLNYTLLGRHDFTSLVAVCTLTTPWMLTLLDRALRTAHPWQTHLLSWLINNIAIA